MNGRIWHSIPIVAVLLAGCASGEEWREWQAHGAHFASRDHLVFSLRNRDGAAAGVSRADLSRASAESWWGRAVTVDQNQILER